MSILGLGDRTRKRGADGRLAGGMRLSSKEHSMVWHHHLLLLWSIHLLGRLSLLLKWRGLMSLVG